MDAASDNSVDSMSGDSALLDPSQMAKFKNDLEIIVTLGQQLMDHVAAVSMNLVDNEAPHSGVDLDELVHCKGLFGMMVQFLDGKRKRGFLCQDTVLHGLLKTFVGYEVDFVKHLDKPACYLSSEDKNRLYNFFPRAVLFRKECMRDPLRGKRYISDLVVDTTAVSEAAEADVATSSDSDSGGLPKTKHEWRRKLMMVRTEGSLARLLLKAQKAGKDKCVFCGNSFSQARNQKKHFFKQPCAYMRKARDIVREQNEPTVLDDDEEEESEAAELQQLVPSVPPSAEPCTSSALPIRAEISRLRSERLVRGDLTEGAYKGLLYEKSKHDEQMQQFQEALGPLRQLLDTEYELCSIPGLVSYDTEEEREERTANWANFWALREEAMASVSTGQTVSASPPPAGSLYDRSVTDLELEHRYQRYLQQKVAKGKMQKLSSITVTSYMAYIFSVHRPNSFSQFCKTIYGADFQLCRFMFALDGEHVIMDEELLRNFVVPDNLESGASLAQGGLCAVISLLSYFLACSSRSVIDHNSVEARGHRSEWKAEVARCKAELTAHLGGLNNLSAKQALAKKKRRELASPGEERRRTEAFDKYCASRELQEKLTFIEGLVIMMQRGEPISALDFNNAGRWLMLVTTFFNGARRQATELLANAHVVQSQRATEDELRRIQA